MKYVAVVLKAAALSLALTSAAYIGRDIRNFHEAMTVIAGMFGPYQPYQKPEIAWKCGKTIIGYASKDTGKESGSGYGQLVSDVQDTIVIDDLPQLRFPGRIVLMIHSTAHAYSTWGVKLNGEWCERVDQDTLDQLGGEPTTGN
jgi:hypothetical protein